MEVETDNKKRARPRGRPRVNNVQDKTRVTFYVAPDVLADFLRVAGALSWNRHDAAESAIAAWTATHRENAVLAVSGD